MFNTPGLNLRQRQYGVPPSIGAVAAVSLMALIFAAVEFPVPLALAVMFAWAGAIWITVFCARNRFDHVVMAWLIAFPYCYYFFSFPRDHPLFTVDRVFMLLVLAILLQARHHAALLPLESDIQTAGYLWAIYVVICLASLWGHSVQDVLGSYRLVLDGVVLPGLLGLYALRFFPVMTHLKKLHACMCILMISLALVTGLELLTGTNLFPWAGAVDSWVQSDALKILRVDGPFESSGILCLVSTFGFFFLVYTRRIVGRSLGSAQRVLHQAGLFAALAAAFMPLNRGLFIALFVCGCIDYFAARPLIARRVWSSIFAGLLLTILAARLFYPSVFEDRVSSGDNVYQRIAQNQQTLKVVLDHPLLGAGFNLYHELVTGNSRYAANWHGFDAINIPHSSLFTVLAEGGIAGFLAYVSAQLFFVRAMWRMRHGNRLGWQAFLYCVLVYNIYGLDAGIVYFSDLNLFYMFVAGTILQIQLHTRVESQSLDHVHAS